jgi:hypothetical protein
MAAPRMKQLMRGVTHAVEKGLENGSVISIVGLISVSSIWYIYQLHCFSEILLKCIREIIQRPIK